MQTINKYILTTFLKVFNFLLLSFVLIFIIVNLFENFSKFLDSKVSYLVIIKYYTYSIPYITTIILPVTILLACFFSIGNLSRNFELIAMKSAGLSLIKILSSIFLFGLLLSILMIYIVGEIVPKANKKVEYIDEHSIDGKPDIDYSNRRDFSYLGQSGHLYHIKIFDYKRKLIETIEIKKIDEGQLKEFIYAKNGSWDGKSWIFKNCTYRKFEHEREIEYTQYDEVVFPFLKETPEDFRSITKTPEEMTLKELKSEIQRKQRLGDASIKEQVHYHVRFSYPFANFIIILLGAPLSAVYKKSGSWISFIIFVIISLLFIGCFRFTQTMGNAGNLPPFIASWITNIIFFSFGGVLFWIQNRR